MTIGEIIKSYWGFTAFLLGLVVHAIWIYYRVVDHDKKIEKMEVNIIQIEKERSSFREEMRTTMAQLTTSVDFIKQAILDLKREK